MPHLTTWSFLVADVLALASHCVESPSRDNEPGHGNVPVLRLWAQGDLYYLTSNANPPQLVDLFDPDSVQRVYAFGHSHHRWGVTQPADEQRFGTPTLLGALPLLSAAASVASLLDQLHNARNLGHPLLEVTFDFGQLDAHPTPIPRPAPSDFWVDTTVEVFGLEGRWPGQIAANNSRSGWATARFTPDVAQQIAATAAACEELPANLQPFDPDATCRPNDPDSVGLDSEGYIRIGSWPWVNPSILTEGCLLRYTATAPQHDPTVPHYGQDTYQAMGALMWLDASGDLLMRCLAGGELIHGEIPQPPEYEDLEAAEAWFFRAVEHELRKAAAAAQIIGGLAQQFSHGEVESLIITAAEAVFSGLDSLSPYQIDLARRASDHLAALDA